MFLKISSSFFQRCNHNVSFIYYLFDKDFMALNGIKMVWFFGFGD